MRMSVHFILTLALLCTLSTTADAYDYRGNVYARNSGASCRGDGALSQYQTYGIAGVMNSSGVTARVWCPITRRNSTPFGKKESADTTLDSHGSPNAFTPTGRINQIDVEIQFTPSATATTRCWIFGRTAGPSGVTITSSGVSTCLSTQAGCGTAPRTQTLSWTNPFNDSTTGRPLVNIGYKCDLQANGTIIGSVASFSGNYVAVPKDWK